MNTTDTAPPSAYTTPADCQHAKGEFLTALGRIYLEAGLPLAAAFEAALADLGIFDVCCQTRP